MNSTITDPTSAIIQTYCEVSPLSVSDRTTIARVLTWDMCNQVQAHEVITIAVNKDIVQIKLTGGRAALLSVDTFKLILKQQQVDEDVAIVEQQEQKLDQDSKKIEIARVRKIYPVNQKWKWLGTFYPVGKDWNWQRVNPLTPLSTSDRDREDAA